MAEKVGQIIYLCGCEADAYPGTPVACATHGRGMQTFRALKPADFVKVEIQFTPTTCAVTTTTPDQEETP